jgi:putative glutamine amidotransferase
MSRPIIGITGPDTGGLVAWLFTRWAVRAAGGHPVWIRPSSPVDPRRLEGLILGGGADVISLPDLLELSDEFVATGQHNQRRRIDYLVAALEFSARLLLGRRPAVTLADGVRDELEFRLLGLALERGIPVLGICRGAQLMNIHHGGTLHTTLSDYYSETPQPRSAFPAKEVTLARDSRLAAAMNTTVCRVNSLHNQAVALVTPPFRVVATEANGIVQAIEHTTAAFCIGVQWHPEYLPQCIEQRRLFRAFVAHARQRSRTGIPARRAPPAAAHSRSL